MAGKTLKELASLISMSPDELIARLSRLGVEVDENTVLTDEQKKLLLSASKEGPSKKTIQVKKKSLIDTKSSGRLTIKVKKKKISESRGDIAKQGLVDTVNKITANTLKETAESKKDATEETNEKEPEAKSTPVKTEVTSPVKTPAKQKQHNNFTKKEAKEKGYAKDKWYDAKSEINSDKKAKKSRFSKTNKDSVEEDEGSFIVKTIKIPETIRVVDLAQKMSIKAVSLIKIMMENGVIATLNQTLDQETASIIVEMVGHKFELLHDDDLEKDLQGLQDENQETSPRAPVVTIMGHVDHGKTTLLDYIRSSRVTSKEAGGITQHIGAYHVDTNNGAVTFLDTPGHEAFTAMRARGSKITDIVILVVAADDGVMPQTLEAIAHAKAANVPLVVAVNKIDKPAADPDRVMTELSQHDVIPESWGGDVLFKNISAKTGEGVNELLEDIALQSEMMELKAVATGLAQGVIIESKLDRGRGPVITVLVQSGLLRKGDIILVGHEFGRVRALINDCGESVPDSGPAMPVEVLGLSGLPKSGERVIVVPSEKKAREVALYRKGKFRDIKLAKNKPAGLEPLFDNVKSDEQAVLNIVLKADVDGSVEAINESLHKLSTDRVKVVIVSSGVGAISESDSNLALASNAIVIGFNVRADAQARVVIEKEGIKLYYYSIIYDLLSEVKSAMKGLAAPQYRDKVIGLCEVREVFRSSKFGVISGCMVLEGIVKRGSLVRIIRDNVVIFNSEISSVRRYKDDVAEVKHGTECGISIKDYRDVKEKDQLEVYIKELVDVEL
ncbi:MAG: translation initiation factor IF-2 [Pseudomonadota bacterium]|nr:translation initiation factor IF-2 [Pseudomonadota bacterium]